MSLSLISLLIFICGLVGGVMGLMLLLNPIPFVRRLKLSLSVIGLVTTVSLVVIMVALPARPVQAAAAQPTQAAAVQLAHSPAVPEAPTVCVLKRPAGHISFADPVDQDLADGVEALAIGDLQNIKSAIRHFVYAFNGANNLDVRHTIARDNLGCALLKLAHLRNQSALSSAANDSVADSSQSAVAPTPVAKTWAPDQLPLCVFDATKLFADSLSLFSDKGSNRPVRDWLKTQLDPRMNTTNANCRRVPEMNQAIEEFTPPAYIKANVDAAFNNCTVTIYSMLSGDPKKHETDRLSWVTLDGETQLIYVDEEIPYDQVDFMVAKGDTYKYHIDLTILYDDESKKPANHRKSDGNIKAACGSQIGLWRCPYNDYQTWLEE